MLSWERPNSGITETVSFTQEGSSWLVKRTTNRFWKGDRRLGNFSLAASANTSATSEVTKLQEKLQGIMARVPSESRSTIFTATTGKTPHAEFIMLNGLRYGPDSALFNEIDKTIKTLIELPMNFRDGVELSTDYLSLTEWKEGKPGPKTSYDDIANCPSLNQRRTCRIEGQGILHFP